MKESVSSPEGMYFNETPYVSMSVKQFIESIFLSVKCRMYMEDEWLSVAEVLWWIL